MLGIGFFILLGNIAGLLVLAIDRFMVSFLFPVEQFAVYSLALSIAVIASTFVMAIAQVFLPYLSQFSSHMLVRTYKLTKSIIIISWAAALILYFPLSELVQFYLPQYNDAIPVMRFLICTTGLMAIIQILHINYYKILRRQREYFILALGALAAAAFLNIAAIQIWGTLTSVAVATIISFSIWYLINEIRLRSAVKQTANILGKDSLAILITVIAFLAISSIWENSIAAMLIYIVALIALILVFFRSDLRELISAAKKMRRNRNADDRI